MKQKVPRGSIIVSVFIVTALQILNIAASLRNNRIIEENRMLQRQAKEIETTVEQFAIMIIHNLDLGLRGYALFEHERYLYPMNIAIQDKDSLMQIVEVSLAQQNYPLHDFYILKDSINSYAGQCIRMKYLYEHNQKEEFTRIANLDNGYKLWLQYDAFLTKVSAFETSINQTAQAKYNAALNSNLWIQIALLIISLPTLLFTAYRTRKGMALEVRLRQAEEEKAILLADRNTDLERIISERTMEIQSQKDVLQAQHNEILTQYDELQHQREELTKQNQSLLESKREQLELYTEKIVEKSEIIARISSELEAYKGKPIDNTAHIENFRQILNSNLVRSEDWEKFRRIFSDVYPNFFASLKYNHPDMSVSEIRLAALIKLNLSINEMADILAISPSSVKKGRHRLKKRLEIPADVSLEDFMKKFG